MTDIVIRQEVATEIARLRLRVEELALKNLVLEEEVRKRTLTPDEREALTWFTGGNGPVCPRYMAIIMQLRQRLT
jgi:hypothetical protein